MAANSCDDRIARRRRWTIALLVLAYVAVILFAGCGAWQMASVQANYYAITLLDLLFLLGAGLAAMGIARVIGTTSAFILVVLGGVGIAFAGFDAGFLFHPHGNGPLSNLELLQSVLAAASVAAAALGAAGVIFRAR